MKPFTHHVFPYDFVFSQNTKGTLLSIVHIASVCAQTISAKDKPVYLKFACVEKETLAREPSPIVEGQNAV